MQSIKLIDRDTDISKLKMRQMDWDTVINRKPYFVVLIEGYIHTIGGKYGNNNLWAYPRNEKPSCENLVQFNGEPVCWGINYAPYNHARYRHDEFEAISFDGFQKKIDEWYKDKDFELCDPPISAQFALDLIFKTLVDDREDYPYLTTMPENTEQTNSIMLDLILRKYSRKYRKYLQKQKRRKNK